MLATATPLDLDLDRQVREEMEGIRREVRVLLERGGDPHALRGMLARQVPALLQARARVLVETVLNWLMQDARRRLEHAPAAVQNRFFDLDLRRLAQGAAPAGVRSLELPVVRASSETVAPELVGVLVGAAVTVLLPGGLLLRICAGLAGLAVTTFALGAEQPVGGNGDPRAALHAAVQEYLLQSEQTLRDGVYELKERFEAEFARFCRENGVADGSAA